MLITAIPAFTDNYIWGIIHNETKTFDCVDPGDATPVIDFIQANDLQLRTILLTHHHFDHIGGVEELFKLWPECSIYAPDDPRIPLATKRVMANQDILVSPMKFRVLFNPGHTSTHISYYEPDQEWLFCGDTLFSAGCGRVFDGTIEELHQSMQLFKSLPLSTKVFCAHEYTLQNLRFAQSVEPNNSVISDYAMQIEKNKPGCTLPSTLANELSFNPFLRMHVDEVKNYAKLHGAETTDSMNVFKVLREQKNIF